MLYVAEQLQIWCSGKFLSFDGLPNLMLKRIWCGSEGRYDDCYLKVVMMIYTLESKVQIRPILYCVIRGLFAWCLHFLLVVATIRMYYCSLEHRRSQGGAKGVMAPQMKQIWHQFVNISLNSWGKQDLRFLDSPIGYLQSFAPPPKFLVCATGSECRNTIVWTFARHRNLKLGAEDSFAKRLKS